VAGPPEPDVPADDKEVSSQTVAEEFQRHRERLKLMVALRLDHRLRGRVDASDVLQDAYLEAVDRLPDYLKERPMPFFLWLRFLTAQRLQILHRRHLSTRSRDAGREISLSHQPLPAVSSEALAARLIGRDSTPSEAAMRAETRAQLHRALDALNPIDREILAMRHFEQLSNSEAAQVLGLRESTASQRYARALLRLKDILRALPGFSQARP
jgi:RNA polymerase sigma-70 factor (ECF subfamily)